MIFNRNQINSLLKVIDNYHVVFIAKELGTDILSTEDKLLLKRSGIDLKSFTREGKLDHAFSFGLLTDALKQANKKNISYKNFQKFLKSGKFLPLTVEQKAALNTIKTQAYSDIKGLGNKVGKDFTTTLVEIDKRKRHKYEKVLKEEMTNAILNKSTLKELSSSLGHRTKDWTRDFDRISDYVMHDAFDRGKALSLVERVGVKAKCYKSVLDGSCEHCQRLYLTNGIGSKPKIFTVDELLSNGSNIGRKTKDWKPVVGSTHPWCRCELVHIPADYAWDDEKNDFIIQRNSYGVQRKSKVSVTLNDKRLT